MLGSPSSPSSIPVLPTASQHTLHMPPSSPLLSASRVWNVVMSCTLPDLLFFTAFIIWPRFTSSSAILCLFVAILPPSPVSPEFV